MMNRKPTLSQKQRLSKLYRWRSLILATLLFFLSLGVPLAAQPPTSSVHQNPARLVEQGKDLYRAGQFEEAATIWQRAADALATREDRLNQAMALSNLSLTYQQLGRWEQAQGAIASSRKLLQALEPTPEQRRILASTLDIQGQMQLAAGQSATALETWQQAAAIYNNSGDRNGKARNLISQAQAMQELGLYPRACKTLLEALDLDSQNCELSQQALQKLEQNPHSTQLLALRSLGNVLRVVGQLEQSQRVLSTSWQLAQQMGDRQTTAEIYLSLGNTARALGNRNLAELNQPPTETQRTNCLHSTPVDFYQQAASCYQQAESSASPSTKLQAQLNHLSLSIQTRQWSQVQELLPKIQSQFERLPASRAAVYAEINFARSLMCLHSGLSQESSAPILQQCPFVETAQTANAKALHSSDVPSWQAISQLLTTALNQAQSLEDKRAEVSALGYLGGAYQQMGKVAQAQQFTEQALQQGSVDTADIAYLWHWQLGYLRQLQADRPGAIGSYTLAFDILQSLRQDLVASNPEIQFAFRDSVEPIYRELVDLLLQPEKPSQENLKQARDVIEALQLAELNNFFQEACLDAQPQPIDQLDPKAAVIYSIILPQRLAVILSLPGQPLRYYPTPLAANSESGAAEVERVFDDLFATLNPFISSPEPLRPYQQFYDWLVRPVAAELEKSGVETLVFVLDGVLRGVPMAALHDGQQFLIEQYSLALTPGLQLLNPRSLALDEVKTLAGGLAESRQGFSSLPGVVQEVEDIAEVVPTEVLLNQEFTRSRLHDQIETEPFPVVHLATHGQFSSQAENTFLLAWDTRINVKDLDQLLQGQNDPNRSPVELLILSACQTAAGDKRAALGLAGVAVRSGARSTVATLWSVRDESTAELMKKFYETLKQPGVTKAAALRSSQLSLLKSSQYRHPFYWAPFVLVGNWL